MLTIVNISIQVFLSSLNSKTLYNRIRGHYNSKRFYLSQSKTGQKCEKFLNRQVKFGNSKTTLT